LSDGPLDAISDIQDAIDYMTELDVFIDDEEFMEVMNLAVKLVAKPNVPHDKLIALVVQLEAYALVFRTKFVAFQSFKKGEIHSTHKKNMYKEIYTGLDNLVAALKYQIR
jgi:hypothetical protein